MYFRILGLEPWPWPWVCGLGLASRALALALALTPMALLTCLHFSTCYTPSVDNEQGQTSLMDGGRSHQLAGESHGAGGVSRPSGRVRRRQTVQRPVTDVVGEVEHEARSIGEGDDSEA